MQFKQNNALERFGEISGYLFSYFLFTTALFFIFHIMNKLPNNNSYLYMMALTFIIVISGLIIKRVLK